MIVILFTIIGSVGLLLILWELTSKCDNLTLKDYSTLYTKKLENYYDLKREFAKYIFEDREIFEKYTFVDYSLLDREVIFSFDNYIFKLYIKNKVQNLKAIYTFKHGDDTKTFDNFNDFKFYYEMNKKFILEELKLKYMEKDFND